MTPTEEEKAARNHPVPAVMMFHAIKAIIDEKREAEFLSEFEKAFVLASEADVRRLKAFLSRHSPLDISTSASVKMVLEADRC